MVWIQNTTGGEEKPHRRDYRNGEESHYFALPEIFLYMPMPQ